MYTKSEAQPHQNIDTTFASGRNLYLHEGFSTDVYSCTFYDFELVTRGKFLLYVKSKVVTYILSLLTQQDVKLL